MSGRGFFFFGRGLILLQFLPGILAWGKEGHYAICKIAEGLLTEDAAAAVQVLLPESAEGDLASVCSWADEIRHNYHWRWSGPLHYVDTPDFKCNYDYCRDCHDTAGHRDRCVSGAIYNYSSQLMDYQDSDTNQKYNLTESLMFLSHFIGDIHQPLHVGFIGDEGGNTIIVRWYRRKTNLHHVWDTMIIESAMKQFYNSNLAIMIQGIQKNMEDDWSLDISSWKNCGLNQTVCPDPEPFPQLRASLKYMASLASSQSNMVSHAKICQFAFRFSCYATESVKLACKYAYRNATPGSTLTDDYFLSRLPVVEKRLAQAGVRLAATLNRIFLPYPSIWQQ